MKNIFRILMAVAVLLTASCAKEDISSSIGGGEVEMTLTVDLPELGTRAFGNGENANILFYNIYEAGTENKLSDLCGSVESNTGVFNVHIVLLKGMQYDLVFWAQNKDCGYYTLNGKQVTAVYEGKNANDDVRDAFYNFIPNFNPANPETTSFALHRPFAQLNAAVKDSDIDAVEASDVDLTTSTVEVDTYTGFNIATGDVTGNKSTVTFVATAVPSTEVFRTGYTLLSMNYLLVPKAGMVSNAAFSFNAKKPSGDAFTFTGTSYNDVPLKQNYRTNILGSLLTKPTDFTVTIDAVFDVPDKDVVQTAAELQQQIENAPDGEETEIVLGGDIDLNDLLASLGTLSTRAAATLPIVIPAEKSIILDLNGCTINAPFEDENAGKHYYAFENRGTLTIKDTKGNGVINARGNFNYGTMTVESGTINATDGNGGYAIRNYEGATFTMNGGTIATTLEDDNQVDKGGYDATTLRVDEGATATINGGVVNNICDFTYAVDNHGDLTIKGGEFTSIHSTIGNNGTMTIDGGSFTCNGLEGITAHCVVAWDGSTTTINGGTFDGKDNYNGFNVDADEGATVYIKGGLFMPVHSGSLYGNGNIVVSGGKFFDEIEDSRLADGCILVQEQEGGYWVVNITPAAQIGDTPYYTLEEAVDAVQNSETIQLLRNVTLTETAVIAEGKSVVLDLNGKTITGTMDNSVGHVIKNEGTLTIKNGTISSTAANGGSAVYNYGTLTVENTTLNGAQNGASGTASYALNTAGNGSSVELNYVNISGRGAIGATNGTKVTVNSGSYHTPMAHWGHAVYANGAGTEIVINGGTFTEGYNYAADLWGMYQIYAGNGSKVIVNNGDFSQDWDCANGYDLCTATDGAIVIYGGTFADNPSSQNGKNFVAAGYKAVKIGETWTVYKNIEASDASAFADALAQGGVVTLGADITLTETAVIAEGKSVVIDLNGKTVTGTMDKSVGHVIKNEGTLTIKNGTIKSTANNGGSAVQNNGILVVEDATLNGAPNADGSWPSYTVNNTGKMTISNTKITSYHGAVASYGDGAVVTLNDSEIDMNGIPGFTSHGMYTYNSGKIVVNGGTYVNKATDQASSGASVINGAIEVNAGTFSGRIENYYGTPVLKGGTYSVNPNTNFVAAGYEVTTNSDGTYSVVAK